MRANKKKNRGEKNMSRRAMQKTKGGSTVSGLLFSNSRTKNNPEPRQGPLMDV